MIEKRFTTSDHDVKQDCNTKTGEDFNLKVKLL